jgi:hypothetical protein
MNWRVHITFAAGVVAAGFGLAYIWKRIRSRGNLKPETINHLNKVEAVLSNAKAIVTRHGYPDDLRTVIVVGFIDQMFEHHEAMLILVRSDKVGSAFALARSIFESMYRGLWINLCATDAQIQSFERDDELPLNMTQMARAIDLQYHAGNFFEDLKNRGWKALCSYTHTGLLQLGRRFNDHNVQPAYTDGQIFQATTTVTTCILLLVAKFLVVQNNAQESQEAEALIRTYGPLAQRNTAPSA